MIHRLDYGADAGSGFSLAFPRAVSFLDYYPGMEIRLGYISIVGRSHHLDFNHIRIRLA